MVGSVRDSSAMSAHRIASTLLANVRRHIERLRQDPLDHPASKDILRQYREYGLGMIRMLTAYHELCGIVDRECLPLAAELEEAYREAIQRVSASKANADRERGRRGGPRWRRGLQRGDT